MTTLHISTDQIAGTIANRFLTQDMEANKKEAALPVLKYNVLAGVYNGATVLLVAAAVSALFVATTSAFVYGAIGFALRHVCSTEIDRYAVQSKGVDNHEKNKSLNLTRSQMILLRFGVPPDRNTAWAENRIDICGFVAWKNFVPPSK